MSNKDDDDDDDVDNTQQELVQCPACFRRMREDVFIKHPNTCQKNPSKKRDAHVFDMKQYRSVKSGDKILPVCKILPTKVDKPIARPSQTRSAKRDRRSDTLVPPVVDHFCTLKRIDQKTKMYMFSLGCPNCKRTFCEKAYDRHVAFCTSKTKRIQQPPSEVTLLARLKLDRRIKFTSNRNFSTAPKPSVTITPISTTIINREPINPSFCLLPLRKKASMTLAHCPWCSKPYIPNCTHYCRNIKELFPIH